MTGTLPPATAEICTLCALELPEHPILDEDAAFCCGGCHTVYKILEAKGNVDDFASHPIFQQAVEAGLISNPALLEQLRRQKEELPADELEHYYLEIEDMWCPSCAEIIKLVLLQEKGVKNCVVDYSTDMASIEFAPRYLSKNYLNQVIKKLGYSVRSLQDPSQQTVSKSLWKRFGIAAFCALNAMMSSYPLYVSYFLEEESGLSSLFAWYCFAVSIPVVTYCMQGIWKRFYHSLRFGLFGMESLVVMGVSTGFTLSCVRLFQGNVHVYFDSLCVIVALVLLGKIIEAKAKYSAKDTVFRLQRSLPRRGRKRFDDEKRFVPVKDIHVGDILEVYSGEKVVLDGEVIEGSATCDESLLTGESIPIPKSPGTPLIAGAIVHGGILSYRVTRSASASALQRILHEVENDLGKKTVYIRAADAVVRYFVPVVLCIALFTALGMYFLGIQDGTLSVGESAITRALSILLISCPCALGIAAPLAESLIMNQMAQNGALVRNRGALRILGCEDVTVFDKTGTITEGHFRLLRGHEDLSPQEIAILQSLASLSTHPISAAIAQAFESSGISFDKVQEFSGKGLKGFLGTNFYLLGSEKLLQEQQIPFTSPENDSPASIVYFASDTRVLACLELGDRLREGALELLQDLPSRTVLLSGDADNVVQNVAQRCGFHEALSRQSPLEKRAFVDALKSQGKTVCMFGDGINDAPALTAANISVSVVSATDISIQVSDVLLTTDRLSIIKQIRQIAVKGQAIVKQNLFWAFSYNCLGIALAVCGKLAPLFSAIAMVASSLAVVLNALRCKRL